MDHKEKHHQQHLKEREHKKKEQKEHERMEEKKNFLPFHPAWLVGLGFLLVLAAVLVWTFVYW